MAEAAAFSSGGWLVQILTAPVAILVDTATFIASAGLVARIKAPEPRVHRDPNTPSTSMAAEVMDGLRTLGRQPILRGMLFAGLGLNVSSGFIGTAILLYLNQEVGFDPGILGMIFAVGGVTSFLGAMFAGRLSRFGIGDGDDRRARAGCGRPGVRPAGGNGQSGERHPSRRANRS